MLQRETLAELAEALEMYDGVLCAHCGNSMDSRDEVCTTTSACSNGGVVYDPSTDTFIPPLGDDPIDRVVVELPRPAHGLPAGVAVLDDLVDEAPAPPKRARRPRFVAHRSETAIQAGCKAALLAAGGYVVVTTGSKYMTNGTPDLLGCLGGRFVAVEVKRPGEVPRPDQMGELRRWQTAGAVVGWVCDERQMVALLARANDRGWHNPLTGPGDGSTT